MLDVERRVKQMRLNHVFNIVHNTSPIYLRQNFTTISHHYCNTSSANCHTFILPLIKQCQDKTFYYNAIKDWNDFPLNIKQIKSKTSFKLFKIQTVELTDCIGDKSKINLKTLF